MKLYYNFIKNMLLFTVNKKFEVDALLKYTVISSWRTIYIQLSIRSYKTFIKKLLLKRETNKKHYIKTKKKYFT